MKRPEYVAAAVTACRLMRDEGQVPPDLTDKLGAVFSRSGFTDGYYTGVRGRGMFGRRTKEDVASASSALLHSLHSLYKNEFSRVPLAMTLMAPAPDRAAVLCVRDGDGHTVTVQGNCPQPARHAPFDMTYGQRVLGRTGGTPYRLETFSADVGAGLTLPSASLAALKREALTRLDEVRRAPRGLAYRREVFMQAASDRRDPGGDAPEVRVIFHTAEQVPDSLEGVAMAYLPMETEAGLLAYAAGRLRRMGAVPAVEAPRGLFGQEEAVLRWAERAADAGIRDVMIHNIGLIPLLRDSGLRLHGGFGLNVFNSRSLDAYAAMGLADNELSFELSLPQAAALTSAQPRGLIVRGRIPFMLTRNCPVAASPAGCTGRAREGGVCGLADRTGRVLPVLCRAGCSEVFNPVMMDVTDRIAGRTRRELTLDWVTCLFTDEPAETCADVLRRGTVNGGRPDSGQAESGHTTGLYGRGVL